MRHSGLKRRVRRWNTNGTFSVEVGTVDGVWVEAHSEKPLHHDIVHAIEHAAPGVEWGEIVIPFSSKGCYDPGSTYDPDTAYPPEGNDERLLNGKAWFEADGAKHYFGHGDSATLFVHFEQRIREVEVDTGDDGDYDDHGRYC